MDGTGKYKLQSKPPSTGLSSIQHEWGCGILDFFHLLTDKLD
jgi:hypothetical protein